MNLPRAWPRCLLYHSLGPLNNQEVVLASFAYTPLGAVAGTPSLIIISGAAGAMYGGVDCDLYAGRFGDTGFDFG